MRARTFAFRSDDLTLSGELVTPDEPRCVVVLCHGIPGGGPPDPEDAGYPGFARTMAEHGVAAGWFNFRGCRDAPGDFSVAGWRRDLSAALDAVADTNEGLPLVVVGSSMGGSTAIAACAERDDVAAVALLAAPAHFEAGRDLLADPAGLLQRLRNIGIIRDPAYPSDVDAWVSEFVDLAPTTRIATLAPRPVLVMHGEADEVVPYVHAEALYAAARPQKELIRLPGGGHQLRRDPRAIDALIDWLNVTVVRNLPQRRAFDHST